MFNYAFEHLLASLITFLYIPLHRFLYLSLHPSTLHLASLYITFCTQILQLLNFQLPTSKFGSFNTQTASRAKRLTSRRVQVVAYKWQCGGGHVARLTTTLCSISLLKCFSKFQSLEVVPCWHRFAFNSVGPVGFLRRFLFVDDSLWILLCRCSLGSPSIGSL